MFVISLFCAIFLLQQTGINKDIPRPFLIRMSVLNAFVNGISFDELSDRIKSF